MDDEPPQTPGSSSSPAGGLSRERRVFVYILREVLLGFQHHLDSPKLRSS